MRKYFNKISWWLGVVIIGVIFGLGVGIIKAWTEPVSAPPAGNLSAPINTSNFAQSKIGGLILNTGGALLGLVVWDGNAVVRNGGVYVEGGGVTIKELANCDGIGADSDGKLICKAGVAKVAYHKQASGKFCIYEKKYELMPSDGPGGMDIDTNFPDATLQISLKVPVHHYDCCDEWTSGYVRLLQDGSVIGTWSAFNQDTTLGTAGTGLLVHVSAGQHDFKVEWQEDDSDTFCVPDGKTATLDIVQI